MRMRPNYGESKLVYPFENKTFSLILNLLERWKIHPENCLVTKFIV